MTLATSRSPGRKRPRRKLDQRFALPKLGVVDAMTPADEPARLAALYAMELLDKGANEHFDRVTRLAARLFDVPIALVSLVDADRQWFGARVGLGASETPRCDAFCAHAILTPEILVVRDARTDARFCENPLVLGPPDIRFYAGAPISAPTGHLLGTVCIIDTEPRTLDRSELAALRDLADLVERELYVIGLALTDALTGLGNRRAFVQAGSQLLRLAERHGEPVALLYADLDGLKAVNDRLGHLLGDSLICRAGAVLRSAVRSSDVVARVGGDEFAILMYDTDPGDAEVARRHVVDSVARHNATSAESPLSLSIGVAQARPGESIGHLVERADRVMYSSKRARRSSVAGGQPK